MINQNHTFAWKCFIWAHLIAVLKSTFAEVIILLLMNHLWAAMRFVPWPQASFQLLRLHVVVFCSEQWKMRAPSEAQFGCSVHSENHHRSSTHVGRENCFWKCPLAIHAQVFSWLNDCPNMQMVSSRASVLVYWEFCFCKRSETALASILWPFLELPSVFLVLVQG